MVFACQYNKRNLKFLLKFLKLSNPEKNGSSRNLSACVDVGTRGSALSTHQHKPNGAQRASARPYSATNPYTVKRISAILNSYSSFWSYQILKRMDQAEI